MWHHSCYLANERVTRSAVLHFLLSVHIRNFWFFQMWCHIVSGDATKKTELAKVWVKISVSCDISSAGWDSFTKMFFFFSCCVPDRDVRATVSFILGTVLFVVQLGFFPQIFFFIFLLFSSLFVFWGHRLRSRRHIGPMVHFNFFFFVFASVLIAANQFENVETSIACWENSLQMKLLGDEGRFLVLAPRSDFLLFNTRVAVITVYRYRSRYVRTLTPSYCTIRSYFQLSECRIFK